MKTIDSFFQGFKKKARVKLTDYIDGDTKATVVLPVHFANILNFNVTMLTDQKYQCEIKLLLMC